MASMLQTAVTPGKELVSAVTYRFPTAGTRREGGNTMTRTASQMVTAPRAVTQMPCRTRNTSTPDRHDLDGYHDADLAPVEYRGGKGNDLHARQPHPIIEGC